jgi:hypothetical protein
MILPTKHINFSESLLGFGSYILGCLSKPRTIDDLWEQYNRDLANGIYSVRCSFDKLVLTIVFLYLINAIREKEGVISRCA